MENMCVCKTVLCFYLFFVKDNFALPHNGYKPVCSGMTLYLRVNNSRRPCVTRCKTDLQSKVPAWLWFGPSSPRENIHGKWCCFSFEERKCEDPLLQCRWCLDISRVCFSSCPWLCLSSDTEKPPPGFRWPSTMPRAVLNPGHALAQPARFHFPIWWIMNVFPSMWSWFCSLC